MNKFLLILLSMSCFAANAQTRYIVKFRDKNNSPYSISKPQDYLSAKAIQRRYRQNITIDQTDIPVNPNYIDSLIKISGVVFINASKWLNQVLVEIPDNNALQKITGYSFVVNVSAVGDKPLVSSRPKPKSVNHSVLGAQGTASDTINYGSNFAQVYIHEGEFLHKQHFRGQNMTIAVLDGGFQGYLNNPGFDSMRMQNRMLAEYDFVMNETSVNEDNVHGANCLSIMAANIPGVFVGTAPNANYILFRTEDVATEKPVEEQNWIAAAERADSMGADMISSSLGYTDFDDPQYNHSYAQRNGNTAAITIAADLAAKKGMIMMNAAGNSGVQSGDIKFVMCPADGDSVVAVGSIDKSGVISPSSSWGPNSAGRIKPNIVSVGLGAFYVNTSGNPATGSGTSYANPNIAGLIACLWQAFPDFNNMEIIDAVQRSADRYTNPDERYGYGIPNFRTAYNYLSAIRQERLDSKLDKSFIKIYPVPFRQHFTVFMKAPLTANATMRVIDMSGRIVHVKNMQVIKDNYYTIDITPSFTPPGVYFLHYTDGQNKETIKMISL